MTGLAASAGASDGRARGNGTGPFAAMVAATAKPGRCRGIGIGPRSGSCGGRTSAAAVLVAGALAGAAEGGICDRVKFGGFVVFGLGHAEVGALEVALSVGRGGSLAGVGTA